MNLLHSECTLIVFMVKMIILSSLNKKSTAEHQGIHSHVLCVQTPHKPAGQQSGNRVVQGGQYNAKIN